MNIKSMVLLAVAVIVACAVYDLVIVPKATRTTGTEV